MPDHIKKLSKIISVKGDDTKKAITDCLNTISDKIKVTEEDALTILVKAVAGGEIDDATPLETWLEERFLPNCVFIDEMGYAKMCVDALKILSTTAATDFGGSRQRDFGQQWADLTRGYLGEYAVLVFLKEQWGIDAELGHEQGQLEEYLPMDIHKIKKNGEERVPNLKLGIKAIKWNGIWFDIPGDQFNHSDIHILVKVGAGRDHLVAFFKAISVFKDKILKKGKEIGSLTNGQADELFDKLPTLTPTPAYVCGFIEKENTFTILDYTGHKGRKHYTIRSWKGPINQEDSFKAIKVRESLPIDGQVKFEGIGRFSHDKGYLFNPGNLLWKKEEWGRMIKQL